MKTPIVTLFSLALASATVMGAEPPDPEKVERYKVIFDQFDSNGDKKLSLEEVRAGGLTQDNFMQLDEDGNGELNREEFIVLANDPTATDGYEADHENPPHDPDSTDDGDASQPSESAPGSR